MADKSDLLAYDIAGQVGTQIGPGLQYKMDHYTGFDTAVTTGYYDTGADGKDSLQALAAQEPTGAQSPWGGTSLPRRDTTSTALGNGKAVRVTRYGRPRRGTLPTDRSVDISFSTSEKPWLLANERGFPVLAEGAGKTKGVVVLPSRRTSSNHWVPVQSFPEVLTHFKITTRKSDNPYNSAIEGQINTVNSGAVTLDLGDNNNVSFSSGFLRFNGIEITSKREDGGVVFYATYSYTRSNFRWRYQAVVGMPEFDMGAERATGEKTRMVPTLGYIEDFDMYEATSFLGH